MKKLLPIDASVMELRAQIIYFQRKTKTNPPVVPAGWYPDEDHFKYWMNFIVRKGNNPKEGGAGFEEYREATLSQAKEIIKAA